MPPKSVNLEYYKSYAHRRLLMPLYDYEHKGRKATYTKGEPVDAVRYIILQDVALPMFLQKELVVSAPVLFYAGDTVTGEQIKTKVYDALNNAVSNLANVHFYCKSRAEWTL